MTRYERVMAAIDRVVPDRVPVVLSSIAFCIRYAGHKYVDALFDPDKHVAAQLKVLHELNTDAVWGTHGLTAFAIEALGGNVIYQDNNPPSPGPPIIKDNDFEFPRADAIAGQGRVPIALRAINALDAAVGTEVAVIALAPSPYMLADRLRGTQHFFKDFIRNPRFAHALLEACVPISIELGLAAVEAGANIIWVADPLGSATCISKKHFLEFNCPYNDRTFAALRSQGARIVYHVCGDWNDRLEPASRSVDCLHLAVEADLAQVKAGYGHRVSLMGNVRSVDFIYGAPEDVDRASVECIRAAWDGGGYILSSDCGLPRDTPAENVRAMVRAAERHGVYPA